MARVLPNKDLLQKLSFGDVTSNELYYHGKCSATFHNLYNSETNNARIDQRKKRKKWIKTNAFSKIANNIFKMERLNPDSSFILSATAISKTTSTP